MFGYVINRKMEIIQDGTVAYMSLMENEMRRFQFQQGDSEGFVNYALTIKKMKMSAMFLAHRKFIRVSLRSRGDVDVNLFARKYFNGGGHKKAPGRITTCTGALHRLLEHHFLRLPKVNARITEVIPITTMAHPPKIIMNTAELSGLISTTKPATIEMMA